MAFVEGAAARAGFWRRVGALLIDSIIILLPLQILVAVLFALTNGTVQGNFGFVTTICSQTDSLPERLQPPPPQGFNIATECRSSLLGFETSRTLTLGVFTQKDNVTTGQVQAYSLGSEGNQVDAIRVNWTAVLLLLVYLIVMEWRSGATLGKRLLGIRTVDSLDPSRIGIPFRKAVLRQLAIWIGAVPSLLLLIVALGSNSPENLATNNMFWFGLVAAVMIELLWFIWIIVSISNKRDPVYDRIAATAVLRT